jgi:hypothetical protein
VEAVTSPQKKLLLEFDATISPNSLIAKEKRVGFASGSCRHLFDVTICSYLLPALDGQYLTFFVVAELSLTVTHLWE